MQSAAERSAQRAAVPQVKVEAAHHAVAQLQVEVQPQAARHAAVVLPVLRVAQALQVAEDAEVQVAVGKRPWIRPRSLRDPIFPASRRERSWCSSDGERSTLQTSGRSTKL